jgi:antitoxin MazE
MKLTAQRWGNRLALRLPASVVREMRLSPGSELDLSIEAGRMVVTPSRRQRFKLAALLRGITARTLHRGDMFGSAVGREAR